MLDENFKLLGETTVPQLQQPPSYMFVKDGKIWYYVKMDDEIGFVRMALIDDYTGIFEGGDFGTVLVIRSLWLRIPEF